MIQTKWTEQEIQEYIKEEEKFISDNISQFMIENNIPFPRTYCSLKHPNQNFYPNNPPRTKQPKNSIKEACYPLPLQYPKNQSEITLAMNYQIRNRSKSLTTTSDNYP